MKIQFLSDTLEDGALRALKALRALRTLRVISGDRSDRNDRSNRERVATFPITPMSALQSVLDFIKTGIPAETHKDTKERGFDVMRLYNAIEIDGVVYRVKSTVRKVKQGDRYYTYEVQEMELLEDTQEALGLLNTDNGRQLNSNNSITGAKLLKGVKKTNSNEEILSYSKVVDANLSYHSYHSNLPSPAHQTNFPSQSCLFPSKFITLRKIISYDYNPTRIPPCCGKLR